MIIIFHFPFLTFMQHAVNSVEHHFRNMSKHESYLHFVRKHFWAELSHPRHGNKHVEKDQPEPATEKKQSWHKLDRRLSDKANKRIIVCLDWRLCRCQKMLGSMESRLSITLQKTYPKVDILLCPISSEKRDEQGVRQSHWIHQEIS